MNAAPFARTAFMFANVATQRSFAAHFSSPAGSSISIVMLFVIAESINRFFKHLGYAALTPFVVAAAALIALAVFREKNIALKCYLSLNSIMLIVLWALGAADKITMPF